MHSIDAHASDVTTVDRKEVPPKPLSAVSAASPGKDKRETIVTWKNICAHLDTSTSRGSLLTRLRERRDKATTRRGDNNENGDVESPLKPETTHNKKIIIDNVNGIAKSNEILAIMGASGAGKTTLLNMLNLRDRGNLKTSGEIRVNGQLISTVEQIASISGYVQQDDLFIGCLTVKENLIFQAMLRMEKNYTREERLARVDQVLYDMNLVKCENTPVQIEEKGISGGEKRRLGFACEVLTNPMILFCDEPTTGLDSFMAFSVVEAMRSLANQGRTIICTIHQPSSETFEMFDKLCLLAEGKLAFIGSLNQAISFYESQGYRVPNNYNPADFYIKTMAIVPVHREACLQRIQRICNGFDASPLREQLVAQIEAEQNYTDDHQRAENKIDFRQEIAYKASFFTQMYWLLWRNKISLARNPMAFRVQVTQAVFIATLFGLIYFQLSMNQKGVQNMSGVLFLCLTNNSFGSMFVVVNTFPAEIPIFFREHQKRMYTVIAYYLSKIALDVPIYILMPTIFMSICYWMANLNNGIDRFLIAVLIVVLVTQTSVSFGTFLSACAPSTQIAIALSGPALVPLMIFSGFLLNIEDVPKYFLFLRYLSWFGYANENLLINQFQGVKEIACDNPSEEDCHKMFQSGEDVMSFFKANPENFYVNLLSMSILIVGWRVLTFIVLLIKSMKK